MIILVSRLFPFLLKLSMEDVLKPQLCSWCFWVSNFISLWTLQPLNWQILSTFQEWFGQTQTYNQLPFTWYWQCLLPWSSLVLNEQSKLSLFELMISNLHQYWEYLPSSSLVLTLLLKISSSTDQYSFCGDNDAFCMLKSENESSSDSFYVIGSSSSFLFSWSSSYPYNASLLVKQELDKSCLFNPYSEELPYTRDKMDITSMKSNFLYLLRKSFAT